MKQTLLAIAGIFFISSFSYSQDKIYRNNGKVVECKILEIGTDEIKYKDFNNLDGPTYILETDKITKIVFQNGKTQKLKDNFKDPERYIGQLTRGIKINFFSPLYGYTEFGYEKSMGVGKSYELSLGIIGLGKSETLEYDYLNNGAQLQEIKTKQAGVFISGGYKFGKMPDFLLFGKTRLSHIMQGTYVKPILYLGYYTENQIINKSTGTELGKQHVTFGALQIEIGHQWVFGDRFLLDIYEGLGYGIDNKKSSNISGVSTYPEDDEEAFNYSNIRLGRSPGLSYTFGIKLGVLIK
ncbi:MAG TPA: hypothetical protein VGI82_12355 [Chitinophagaceae bacterium]|jgi:hypothetical protein